MSNNRGIDIKDHLTYIHYLGRKGQLKTIIPVVDNTCKAKYLIKIYYYESFFKILDAQRYRDTQDLIRDSDQ